MDAHRDQPAAVQRGIVRSWRRLTGGPGVRDADRPTLLAVSGGADSTALALALAGTPGVLAIGHVVHDLRPPERAEADRRLVEDLGRALGLAVLVERVSVRARPREARRECGNAEASARALRYAALSRLAAGAGCRYVAVAHQAEDVLETMLANLLRGAGPRGLRGPAPRRRLCTGGQEGDGGGVWLVRPMLGVTRAQAEALCAARGRRWAEDATNLDTGATDAPLRAALRARVLPALESVRPGAAKRAARAGEAVAQAVRVVEGAAGARWPAFAAEVAGGLRLEVGVLEGCPPAVGEALLRRVVAHFGGAGHDRLSAATCASLLAWLRTGRGERRVAQLRFAHAGRSVLVSRAGGANHVAMAKKSTASASTPTAQAKPSTTAPYTPIALDEFKKRRQRLAKILKDRVGLVFAGEHSASLRGDWAPSVEFAYLTGVTDEPGAALLLDPSNPNPRRREVLLLRARDPEDEQWHGLREPLGPELRDRLGVGSVFRTNRLHWLLTEAASRVGTLATLHEPRPAPAGVNQDLAAFRLAAERVPGVRIESAWREFYQLIAAKSPAERRLVQGAIDATIAGVRAAARQIRPGASEAAVVRALEAAFAGHGGEGNAFNPIAGSGVNATVLHYGANNRTMRAGDLLVLDSGTTLGGYCADITRTFPVGGTFGSTQADAYDLVLRAMRAAIAACTPGTWMHDVDMAAREVIDKAGYAHAFYHGVGHHLGLSVHDADPRTPLAKNAIVTIEPGLYLPQENIGIRIEDDILVTAQGPKNLSAALPADRKGVEALMG